MYKPDLEEDFEALYGQEGFRPDPYGGLQIPVGRCQRMCSYPEMQERELNRRLSKYETLNDTSYPPKVDFELAIKEFRRSCGQEFTRTEDLRPWTVLKRTLRHLLLTICFQEDDWMFICDFVFDRLKAVRQDMVIQRIEGRRYIEVLEGSVRFLIYSMYRLTCTVRDYCKMNFLKPIISLEGQVSGLNNYEMNVVREMKLTMKSLRDCISSLLVQYEENVPDSQNRSLFEAVNLIVNLPFLHGHVTKSTEYQARSELRNQDPIFKLVFKMYREHLIGNHWTALKYLPLLSEQPLLVLAYAPAIAHLQVHLVNLLKKLYQATGSNTSTVKQLCDIICPEWLDEDEDERLLFGRFIATQFGFYDEKRKLCDYKMSKPGKKIVPGDFVEKSRLERLKVTAGGHDDNETRTYALQMIAGRDWYFYREVLRISGVEKVLDPCQPAP